MLGGSMAMGKRREYRLNPKLTKKLALNEWTFVGPGSREIEGLTPEGYATTRQIHKTTSEVEAPFKVRIMYPNVVGSL